MPQNEYVAGLFGKYNYLSPKQLQLFHNHSSQPSSNTSIFVRPEQFSIHINQQGVPGKVLRIGFLGSSYDLDILMDDFEITVKVPSINLQQGDTVYVQLNG